MDLDGHLKTTTGGQYGDNMFRPVPFRVRTWLALRSSPAEVPLEGKQIPLLPLLPN